MKTYASLVLLAAIGLAVVVMATAEPNKQKKCDSSDYNCGDKCIPRKFVCDGVYDCGNGNDESNCPRTNSRRRTHSPEETLGFDAPTFDLEFL